MGTEAQASAVLRAGAIGTTLLTLEHEYGGVPRSESDEAKARLDEIGKTFKQCVVESSIAGLSTYVLADFLQKRRLFAQEANDFPCTLTDLLRGLNRYPRPAAKATALVGTAAHLGGLVGIFFDLLRTTTGDLSLYDATRFIILDFPSGICEMQVTPKMEGSRPLLALVALHLQSLSETLRDRDLAMQMITAAAEVYPG